MSHVVVVGAGLVGASCAAELRARGHAVTLLERAVPGAEASSAAGGILSPQAECDEDGPLLELCLRGLPATRALVGQIRDETGVDARLVENGNALIAVTDEDRALLAARVKWQRARGLRVEWIEEGRLALFPDEGRLEPAPYAEGALALARKRGCTVKSGVAVDNIVSDGARARGVRLVDGSEIDADAVVVAAGAWSSQVRGAGVTSTDVFPMRGQIVELEGPRGLLERVTFYGRAYAIPRDDGRILLGSTMEAVGFDKRTTEEGVQRVRENAERAIPALKGLPFVRAWAGLRPATKDGLPLLGERATRGLFLSTGHFRNGILLAAVSAQLLADAIDGRAPRLDLAPFAPDRLH